MKRLHRRRSSCLRGVLVFGVLGGVLEDLPQQASAQAEPGEGACEAPAPRRNWWDMGLGDYVLDEATLLNLGNAYSQGADASEVLETVSRVKPSDRESWTAAWTQTAERLHELAASSEEKGHPISASMAYLRAATYYRTALHSNHHPGSDQVRDLTLRAEQTFARYLALSDSPCQPVAIPYENTTLPGYFCRAPKAEESAPVVIFNPGRDVWAEDGKLYADEANKRGYHALTFDGPGQGRALRLQDLPFRPDWEKVIGPVVDFAIAQRGVDPARIVLWGESMGGYLVPRAAAKEHRLKLIVANPGVIDWYRTFEQNLNAQFPGLLALFYADEAAFDAKVAEIMQTSDFARWGIEDFLWKHGVDSPSELVRDLQRYRMNGLEKQITARTLVVDAEAEDRGQARELYESLVAPKDYLFFTAAEGAQFHDQPGAKAIATHRTYDWIDEHL